jgi:hypothetical protein
MTKRNTMNKTLTLATAIAALLTVVISLTIGAIMPSSAKLTLGLKTPIIAFEFARTEKDLEFLSGPEETPSTYRDQMDEGHIWDMIFPFAYAGLLALVVLELVSVGQKTLWIGVAVAVAIVPFDLYENSLLLGITDALRNGQTPANLLEALHLATWLKWGAIAGAALTIAIGFFHQRNIISSFVCLATPCSALVCKAMDSAPTSTEIMAIMTIVLFAWLTLQSWARPRQIVRG